MVLSQQRKNVIDTKDYIKSSNKKNMSTYGLFPKKYKLVSLGEQSVGKTSLIARFMYDHFDETYQATIGIDFLVKTVTTGGRSDKLFYVDDFDRVIYCRLHVNFVILIRLQLWDTAGLERFRSLIPCYIRESGIALVVYDITSAHSFELTSKWVNDVKGERGDDVIIVLVGNKTDLVDKRQVSTEQGLEKAKELNVLFMETSAKDGHNVKELFNKVVSEIPDLNDDEEPKVEEIHLISQDEARTDAGCYC